MYLTIAFFILSVDYDKKYDKIDKEEPMYELPGIS